MPTQRERIRHVRAATLVVALPALLSARTGSRETFTAESLTREGPGYRHDAARPIVSAAEGITATAYYVIGGRELAEVPDSQVTTLET